jgi:glycyl-tRNA synthetase
LYDAGGSIGKRYARADEIGVPVCITVDHQSIEDRTVTLRNRDDGSQIRISIDELPFL